MARPSLTNITNEEVVVQQSSLGPTEAKLNGNVAKSFERSLSTTDLKLKRVQDKVAEAVNAKIDLADSRANAPASSDDVAIDISAWLDPEATPEQLDVVARQVLKTVLENGSFRIVGHDIPLELFQQLDEKSRAFFLSPIEEKSRYEAFVPMEKENASVVARRPDKERDLRESCRLAIPWHRNNRITTPPVLQGVTEEFINHMDQLEVVLLMILTRALELHKNVELPSNFFDHATGGGGGAFRCNWYPAGSSASTQSLKAHADVTLLTILYSETEGLEEIRNGQWTPVRPNQSGELLVLMGQHMHVWSNGSVPPSIHRVVGSENNPSARTSYAYFVSGSPTTNAIAPVVGPGEEQKYDAIVGSEYTRTLLVPFLTRQNDQM